MPYKNISNGKILVYYSKRNPKSGQPVTLRRKVNTKAEAKRTERELIAAVERKIAEKIIPKWISLIEDSLADCRKRGLNERTVYNMEKCLLAATGQEWSDRLINTITTHEIRDHIATKYGQHSASHRKSLLKFIRRTFEFAVERGDIGRNPTPKCEDKIGDKAKSVLTEGQVKLFLNQAKSIGWHWYPHCAMAVYTGMRNGELYALTWDKVNLKERQIVVNCSWNNKAGFKDTKSGHDRIVEIAVNLLPVMQELKLVSGSSHFVLPRSREWDVGDQARQLRQFLLGIGLPEIRFHDLRATWATLMLSKGVPPIQVMKMGGWKDIKTMMIYSRMAGIDIKGITDCLRLHDPKREIGKVLDFSPMS